MGVLLIGGVFLIALAAVVIVMAFQRWSNDRMELESMLADDPLDTLEYVVPEGQDPAEVLSALRSEGYVAALDPHTPTRLVHVECPGGKDRERARVRSVISAAATAIDDGAAMPGPVRFADESHA